MTTKPLATVFISHISDEKKIALALQQLVESTFLNLVQVFVSSDTYRSNAPGSDWLEKIKTALRTCDIEIILVSPKSATRQWVNYEAGAGYGRDIPVIPLCHSGALPGQLGYPLNIHQAALATDRDQLDSLIPVIARAIGANHPKIDWTPFIDAVVKYQVEFEEVTKGIEEIAKGSPVRPMHGLYPYEVAALAVVADYSCGNDAKLCPLAALQNGLQKSGFSGIAAGLAVKSLQRKEFLEFAEVQVSRMSYESGLRLSPQGWRWLEENQDQVIISIPKDDIPF